MKFYYTGAAKYNTEQRNPSLSIGGFVSSSEIPNDVVANLFGNISKLAEQNLQRQAILIAVKNTFNEKIQGVLFSFLVANWDKLITEFDIAFVASSKNECGDIYFDKINDSGAIPYVTFETLSSSNYQFDLGDFEVGQVIGIWLVRKILKNKLTPISCEQLYANYLNTPYIDPSTGTQYNPDPQAEEESISINLDWSPDDSHSDSV